MMRILAIALIMVVTAGVNAQMLSEGTQEIYGGFDVDWENAVGSSEWYLDLGYGYFIRDYIEVGGIFGYEDSSIVGQETKMYRLGAFGEYNWPIEASMWVPAIQMAASWLDAEITSPDPNVADPQDSAFEITIRPAIKFYLSDPVALDFGVPFRWATEKLYVNDGKVSDTDWGLNLRLRAAF